MQEERKKVQEVEMSRFTNSTGMTVIRSKNHSQDIRQSHEVEDSHFDPKVSKAQLRFERDNLKELKPPKSILSWHVAMQMDAYYSVVYFVLMVAIHFFKFNGGLLYPPHVWEMELTCLICWAIVQATRLHYGLMANRTEDAYGSKIFLVFSFGTLLLAIYFSRLVTYVLLIE